MSKINHSFFNLDHELGQSKSSIEIVELSDGKYAVRKFELQERGRLKKQYDKHLFANQLSISNVKIPKIVDEFRNNSYIMEYMHGLPLGIFLETASRNETIKVASHLNKFLKYLLDHKENNLNSELFIAKLNSFSFEKTDDFHELLNKLIKILINRVKQMEIIGGFNHGDLSFENIIITPNSLDIVLLDFLDSPFDSPLIDLGRFWLDSEFGWWGSGLLTPSNAVLNSKILRNSLIALCSKHKISIDLLNIYAALAILRIYPYTIQPVRKAFLKKATRQLLEIL